jgi:hypothetical protein
MSANLTQAVVIGGFIAWGVYRRIRRSIGRQRLRRGRLWFSLILFGGLSLLLVLSSLVHPALLESIGGGLLLGSVLGWFGLRLTRFESTNQGHFYTPNAHIGIALSFLLIGRIAYRLWVIDDLASAANHPPPMQSPLTLFLFGLLAGYYIVYYLGVLSHAHDRSSPA